GMRSVIYHEYARTTRGRIAEHYTCAAIDAARASLTASAPGRPDRSVLFDNITIATGSFRLGQIDDALSHATTSLKLTSRVDSRRAGDRLRHMAHSATLLSARSDVRDMCHEVEQATRPGSTDSALSNVIVAEPIRRSTQSMNRIGSRIDHQDSDRRRGAARA
ncbi:hypothetical protein, partial [Streptomyces roseolus]|uniref:hypothetical protein n=1 Tax=Streptomyces roseolus TaxID=67358 RepID=UPI003654F736